KAFEIYKASDGSKPLVEIAEELSVSEGTIRGWKNKDKWNDKMNGTFRKNEWNVPEDTERSKPRKKPGKPALKGNGYAKG
ncbi:phage terminase small subunit-related protein, partial [Bacillus wiedmannii]